MTGYKPLTPSLRLDINIAFDKQVEELKTCEPNALVNVQIEGLRMHKRLINGLPDGYPIPIDKRGDGMTLAQLAKDTYPVSITFKGRLSKAQRAELEKSCDVHAMSVYMDGSATYSIRYKAR